MINKQDLADNFFENNLNNEEQILLDKLILEDADFKADFEFQKDFKTAITLQERKKMKVQFQEIEKPKSVPKFKIWYVAASILLILTIALWLNLNTANQEKLYAKYYQTFPNIEAPSTRGESSESIAEKAFYAYDSENFEQAGILFTKLYETEKKDYVLFYRGITQMETKKYNEAILIFNECIKNASSKYNDNAKWYLALCYLRTNETAKCKNILLELKQNENQTGIQAKKLLKELR